MAGRMVVEYVDRDAMVRRAYLIGALRFAALAVISFIAFNRHASLGGKAFMSEINQLKTRLTCDSIIHSFCSELIKNAAYSYPAYCSARGSNYDYSLPSIMDHLYSHTNFISINPFANWAAMTFTLGIFVDFLLTARLSSFNDNLRRGNLVPRMSLLDLSLIHLFVGGVGLIIHLIMVLDWGGFSTYSGARTVANRFCSSLSAPDPYYDSLMLNSFDPNIFAAFSVIAYLLSLMIWYHFDRMLNLCDRLVQSLRAFGNQAVEFVQACLRRPERAPVLPLVAEPLPLAPPPVAPVHLAPLPLLTPEEMRVLGEKVQLIQERAPQHPLFRQENNSEFFCPISLELMIDPVFDEHQPADGYRHTFSREGIVRSYAEASTTCPLSRVQIANHFPSNEPLRLQIHAAIEREWGILTAPAAAAPESPIALTPTSHLPLFEMTRAHGQRADQGCVLVDGQQLAVETLV